MPEIALRLAKQEDLPAVLRITEEAWQPLYAGIRAEMGDQIYNLLLPDWRQIKAKQVTDHFSAHPEWMYVAELAGALVGYICFSLDSNTGMGQIGNNAVAGAARGKGVAPQMYAHVLNIFRASGMRLASVLTGLDEAHAPARRAYQKAGFHHGSSRIVYYQAL